MTEDLRKEGEIFNMKRSNLSKVFGASVLSLSMAVLPLTMPSNAQTETTDTTTDLTTQPVTTTTQGDRDFDWGWLGLLGLIGLAGLAGGNRKEESVRYREPDEVGRTGTRY